MRQPEVSTVCEGLLSNIFRQAALRTGGRGLVIAVTAPHSGAGVTQITRALANALGQKEERLALALDFAVLDSSRSREDVEGNPFLEMQDETASETEAIDGTGRNWHSVQTNLASRLENLRLQYRYLLIDCPSLKETHDVIRLASLVDGIVLVVEANRTQRDQVLYAERVISAAQGQILGHVLNKRSYSIPDWIHRRMDAAGI